MSEILTRDVEAMLAPQADVSEKSVVLPAAADSCDLERWGVARRVLFRFAAIYGVLYFLPFPLTVLGALVRFGGPLAPVGQAVFWLAGQFESGVQWATKWFGYTVLGLKEGAIVIQPTGSGDTMVNYVQSALFLSVAAVGALVWSALDRRRPACPRLQWWLLLYTRLALASIVLGYGWAKVPPQQFQPPGPDRLIQTYGGASPMGLLWTFMGASPWYTMFAGACEILAGVLLLFRRTATLGGLVCAAVMLNVFVLNMCYDVPVKLFSLHLLFAAVLVALPDMGRLANVLILNRPVMPRPAYRFRARRWMWTVLAAEGALIMVILAPNAIGSISGWTERGAYGPMPPLFGMYEVESFSLDGQERPPLTTDDLRWRRLMVGRFTTSIQTMPEKREVFGNIPNKPEAGIVLVLPRGGMGPPAAYSWTESGPGKVLLEGVYKGSTIRALMKHIPVSEFNLNKRGFHWIQEFPINQ